MKVLGVDPGHSGGVAVIEDGRVLSVTSMPTSALPMASKGTRLEIDALALSKLFPADIDLVVVERVWGDAGFGGSRSFTFGAGYGTVIAVVKLLGFPLLRVTPQEWKKKMLPDEDHSKQAAIDLVLALYPGTNLKPPRARKESHDWAEAVVLATYGVRYLEGTLCS